MGELVAERYRVVSSLGEGGMSRVLEAVDERLGRHVALKLLAPALVADERSRERMLREARLAASLEHPGVVQVLDVGETGDGGVFVAMEIVHGRTLRVAATRAEPRQLVRWLAETARALDAAHQRGVVHRDVKPDNVMVRDDGRVVVLDFGIAKALAAGDAPPSHTLTGEGAIVGTLAYLSPEQARGERLDGRSDLFSLAVTGYELLVGRSPWRASSAPALVASILEDRCAPPSAQRPGLPRALDDVLLRALSKAPDQRHESCAELASELEALAEDAEIWRADLDAARGAGGSPLALARTELASTAPARREARRGRPLRLAWLAVVALAGCAALGVALGLPGIVARLRGGPSEEPAPGTSRRSNATLARAPIDGVVACPPLAVERGEPWLGAAVASRLCARIGNALGDPLGGVRVPADLLGAKRHPDTSAPADPWADPSLRAHAVDVARKGGTRWLDGEVELVRGQLHVRLTLRAPGADGAVLASTERSGSFPTLDVELVDDLRAAGVLPDDARAHAELARWSFCRGARCLTALFDVELALREGRPTDQACASLLTPLPKTHPLRGLARPCVEGESARLLAERSLEELAALDMRRSPQDAAALAERLRAERLRATEPYARAALALAEARAFLRSQQSDSAYQAALASIAENPHDARPFYVVTLANQSRDAGSVLGRFFVTWHPDRGWGASAASLGSDDALRWLGRAALLSPTNVTETADLATMLAARGRCDEARGWAARMSTISKEQRVMGDTVAAICASAEGRLADAEVAVMALFARMDRFGSLAQQDLYLSAFAFLLDDVRGRDGQLGDAFFARFVEPEPPRLDPAGASWLVPSSLSLCLRARADVARRCVARLRALDERGFFSSSHRSAKRYLAGAEALARDDVDGARRELRLIASALDVEGLLFAPMVTLLSAGDDDLARRIDAVEMTLAGWLAGATPAHARAALRAEKRREHREARELATTVISAWSKVDQPPRHVAQMRALVARLPP